VLAALAAGAETVIVLDDDCFPDPLETPTVKDLIGLHVAALEAQAVEQFLVVTDPPSRGTPYQCRTRTLPVAGSMGFWSVVGDYDAVGQLVHGATRYMEFRRQAVHGQYFPWCGMNVAFRPREWMPWCRFIDVPRFDDIWAGWLWQKEAYRRGYCFNLAGPIVRHSRQSNVWQNLRDEARYLEENETLWREIAGHPSQRYEVLEKLLPAVKRET